MQIDDFIQEEHIIDLKAKPLSQKETTKLKHNIESSEYILLDNEIINEENFKKMLAFVQSDCTAYSYEMIKQFMITHLVISESLLLNLFKITIEWATLDSIPKLEDHHELQILKTTEKPCKFAILLMHILNRPMSKSIKVDLMLPIPQLIVAIHQIIYFYEIGTKSDIINLQNLNVWIHLLIDSNQVSLHLNPQLLQLIQKLHKMQSIYNEFSEQINCMKTLLQLKQDQFGKKTEQETRKRVTYVYF